MYVKTLCRKLMASLLREAKKNPLGKAHLNLSSTSESIYSNIKAFIKGSYQRPIKAICTKAYTVLAVNVLFRESVFSLERTNETKPLNCRREK